MERYDPRLSEYAARQWLKESAARLPVSDMETRWQIAGFAFYYFDAAGCLWHELHRDGAGHVRAVRRVFMQTKGRGKVSKGWTLRRNTCGVWVGIAAMRRLLLRAHKADGPA